LRSTTFAAALGGGAQATDRATAIFTAIVGAVSLARAVGDEAIAARILADVRALVRR
jgi:TetR/AcrR family transcriptional repressor of nem operon